jgi:hypothetical protein
MSQHTEPSLRHTALPLYTTPFCFKSNLDVKRFFTRYGSLENVNSVCKGRLSERQREDTHYLGKIVIVKSPVEKSKLLTSLSPRLNTERKYFL